MVFIYKRGKTGSVKNSRHSSKRGEKKKNPGFRIEEMPEGIRVLFVYTLMIGMAYLILGAFLRVSMLFGFIIRGLPAVLVNVIFSALIFTIAYGIALKKHWTPRVASIIYILSALSALTSLAIELMRPYFFIRNTLILSSIVIVFLNLLTLWFINDKKHYFLMGYRKKRVEISDKVFISAIYIFYFISILLIFAVGVQSYRTMTSSMNFVVNNLNGKTFEQGISFCKLQSGTKKDICFMSLAILKPDEGVKLCNNIQDEFYKITCYKGIGAI